MKLLEEIAAARRGKGLTQDALAGHVGTDRQGIHRLERGIGSLELLVKVMGAVDFHIVGLARGRTLSQQLGNRRLTLGRSKQDVAAQAGITAATLARMEAGGGSIATVLKVLDAIGPKKMARQKPQKTILTPLSLAQKDKRFTPCEFLDKLTSVWGEIDLDPCAHLESPVRARRRILLSAGGDGLRDDWCGHFTYMNPPFSAASLFLKRANEMHSSGKVGVVVGLVPANTDAAYFQTDIVPVCDIGFLRGRMQFGREAGTGPDRRNRAPFAVMLVVWGATRAEIEHFRSLHPSVWMMHEHERPREIIRAELLPILEFT
ncbi:DNA N-6-adenine-methyltransferase [Novosphingobium sp. P6W]|uniref:DNA N-6-adenine-methyltransferase n=1 Tax=Novosphingobium sp. P6W TaxID=1609758 RepID=UPI000697BD2A|nr:DNA N-6-adenine-methyltransferase [Novosphingobium sp. P6W]AXB77876.1 hypothetical protein TQ38_016310 [Novosphingobium sp. P6W]